MAAAFATIHSLVEDPLLFVSQIHHCSFAKYSEKLSSASTIECIAIVSAATSQPASAKRGAI